MKTYKGFNKDLTCSPAGKPFQYEIGKTYEMDGTPIRCTNNGFHSCEYPLDVLGYYSPATSRFAECEADGKIDRGTGDTKIASSKITIKAEINIKSLVESAVKFIFEKVTWTKENNNSGDNSASQASGDKSASQASGYNSASQASGDNSASQASGYGAVSTTTGFDSESSIVADSKNSMAVGFGINNKAKAPLNCWITLSEWEKDAIGKWQIKIVKTAKVDGKKIKPDTFYSLENGRFVIAK